MTKYIENLNLYLDARKIKQTYLSMKTGIDAGEPAKEQEKIANTLLKLLENIDEVMSAKGRFLNISR